MWNAAIMCYYHVPYDSFHLIYTWRFSSLNQKYRWKNLLKVEKVLTFLSLAFLNLE